MRIRPWMAVALAVGRGSAMWRVGHREQIPPVPAATVRIFSQLVPYQFSGNAESNYALRCRETGAHSVSLLLQGKRHVREPNGN